MASLAGLCRVLIVGVEGYLFSGVALFWLDAASSYVYRTAPEEKMIGGMVSTLVTVSA